MTPRFITIIFATAGSLAMAACSAQQQNQAQSSAKAAGIAASVHAKLAVIDADSTTAVKVQANDNGIVTLTGEARSQSQRSAYTRRWRTGWARGRST